MRGWSTSASGRTTSILLLFLRLFRTLCGSLDNKNSNGLKTASYAAPSEVLRAFGLDLVALRENETVPRWSSWQKGNNGGEDRVKTRTVEKYGRRRTIYVERCVFSVWRHARLFHHSSFAANNQENCRWSADKINNVRNRDTFTVDSTLSKATYIMRCVVSVSEKVTETIPITGQTIINGLIFKSVTVHYLKTDRTSGSRLIIILELQLPVQQSNHFPSLFFLSWTEAV